MRLYNALSQKIETFEPVGETITLYVCGVTPYDTTHLGHAFTYTAFDILIRSLEVTGYQVRYVQNVTDIDDDILRKAKEVGENWQALGNRWTAHFIEDMRTLNVRPPDYYPRATEVIPEIMATVQQLLEVGVAYEAAGNVYYRVDDWPAFGRLSRIPRADMLPIANERGNYPDDPHKHDPLDFVLWQAAAPGEPSWDSPWGPGRPGWHIECSTMATKFLRRTIDIHGGGADLVFPHHECEIAQAEPLLQSRSSASNKPPRFTRFWLHTAMVHHQGDKMSKSLGNLVMARDLLETYSADALRLYLGRFHYRQVWSHDPAKLVRAEHLAQKIRRALMVPGLQNSSVEPAAAQSAFNDAIAQDLNTPKALEVLESLADDILAAKHTGYDVPAAQNSLRTMGRVFGLRLDSAEPEERVTAGWGLHLKRFIEP